MATKKTKEELLNFMESTYTALIDIRTTDEYDKRHIPGSINKEATTLLNNIDELSKFKTIVCICNHGHKRSQQAADTLISAGLNNIYYLEGGIDGWFQ